MTKLIDNNQSLRPRQRQSVLIKLEQHEAKLGDLASKYTVRGSPLLSDFITDYVYCIIGRLRQTQTTALTLLTWSVALRGKTRAENASCVAPVLRKLLAEGEDPAFRLTS